MIPAWRLAWRIAGCTAVSAFVWAVFGLAAAVPTAALWGLALAQPMFELARELVERLRGAALDDVQGRYYVHAGQPIDVIETDDARWLRAADVQKLLDDRSPELRFARRFGAADHRAGPRGRWYVRDAALVDYLARSAGAATSRRNRLRLYVEREVLAPHRRRQRMAGGAPRAEVLQESPDIPPDNPPPCPPKNPKA